MSIQSKFTTLLSLAQSNQSSDIPLIVQQLKKIRRIGNQQKASNMSLIQQNIPKIIYNLANTIEQNISNISDQPLLKQLGTQLRNLKDWIPKNTIQKSYIDTLQTVRSDVNSKIQNQRENDAKQMKEKQLLNKVIASEINTNYQIQPSVQILKLPPSRSFAGIQQQIQGMVDIIDNPPPTGLVDSRQLPATMQLLSGYSEKLGYKPMGSVTGRKSRAYVGIQTIYQDQTQISKPFPIVSAQASGQTPSIKTTFRYHAGKTINAWNKYIQSQQNFIQFANKVSSKQKRQQYVAQQVKRLNNQTFYAQQLSTLVYYYIINPLKFMIAKDSGKQLQYTKTWFSDKYELPPGVDKNPLGISNVTAKQIMQILFKTDNDDSKNKASARISSIIQLLQKTVKTPFFKSNQNKFQSYASTRKFQALSYFKTIGISQAKQQQIIVREDIIGLKYNRFIIPSRYANPQIMALLNKALKPTSKQQDPQNRIMKKGIWKIQWGDQYLPSHDYIWKKN